MSPKYLGIVSPEYLQNVIPVNTRIQKYQHVTKIWTPVFTGVTTFDEVVKVDALVKSHIPLAAHASTGSARTEYQ